MNYKAFISYSHAADNLLAPALQSALHRFAKPFYKLRAVRVFRDKTSLHLTPELWPEIQRALKDSEYFILLASPDAARSDWVRAEVDEWLKLRNNSVEQLLIVQTDGEIEWDDVAGDFDWEKTTALPSNLKGVFAREPFYSDLRWARKSTDLSLRNPQFLDDIGTLGAALHGRSKDEMIGNDVRQHRIFKLISAVVAMMLLALTISASGAALYANKQRQEAEQQRAEAERQRAEAERQKAEAEQQKAEAEQQSRKAIEAAKRERVAAENERAAKNLAEKRRIQADEQRRIADEKRREAERENRIATSRELAANAISQLSLDPELSVLLSIQAELKTHTSESANALRQSVIESRIRHTIQHYTWMDNVEFSPDGKWLIVIRDGAHVLEVGSWEKVAELSEGSGRERSASFSRDGKLIVTTSELRGEPGKTTGVAKIWETGSWKKVAEFRGQVGGVPRSILSSDGRIVAMWSSHEKGQVWRATGERLAELGGAEFRVREIALSPDGNLLVAAGREDDRQIVRVLETATGRKVFDLEAGESAAGLAPNTSPAFSPCGRYLALAYSDEKSRVFETGTGKMIAELGGHARTINDIAFSPDGRWIATASSDHKTGVWAVETWQSVAELKGHTDEVKGLAFSSDGDSLVTSSRDGTARVWKAGTWQNVAVLSGHGQPLLKGAISPDGRYVATSSQDSSARIWEVSGGRRTIEIQGSSEIGFGAFLPMAFSPDGRLVVTKNLNNRSLDIWDVSSERKVSSLDAHNFLAFSPDGKHLFTVGREFVINKWEVGTWKSVAELRGHTKEVLSIAFSPDEKWIVTAGGYDFAAHVWDAKTGESAARLSGHEARVMRAAFSPDGRWIATSSYDKTARIWNTGSWQPEAVLRGHTAEVWSVGFSPDSKLVLTGSYDGSARLWDVGTWKSVKELLGHNSYVEVAAFSPDGRRIVTVGNDSSARLWETETGRALAALRDGDESPRDAAFSPDGKLLATVSGVTAHLWDASTGRKVSEIGVVPPGAGASGTIIRALTGVNFSPDGKLLLTACNDGNTRIITWELFAPIEDLLDLARTRATRELTQAERVTYLHETPKTKSPF